MRQAMKGTALEIMAGLDREKLKEEGGETRLLS